MLIMQKVGLSLFALSLVVVSSVRAAQCTQSEESLCVFTCNGTQFNLTDVFQYPITINDEEFKYTYVWSPCNYRKCPDGLDLTSNCAVCQKADRYYNCGHLENAIFLMQQYDPFMWKIQYPWGSEWRMTEFTFLVDQNRDIPTVAFTGEAPYLQYNFFVTGKCIGQPYCMRGMPDPFKAANGKKIPKPSPAETP